MLFVQVGHTPYALHFHPADRALRPAPFAAFCDHPGRTITLSAGLPHTAMERIVTWACGQIRQRHDRPGTPDHAWLDPLSPLRHATHRWPDRYRNLIAQGRRLLSTRQDPERVTRDLLQHLAAATQAASVRWIAADAQPHDPGEWRMTASPGHDPLLNAARRGCLVWWTGWRRGNQSARGTACDGPEVMQVAMRCGRGHAGVLRLEHTAAAQPWTPQTLAAAWVVARTIASVTLAGVAAA